MIELLRAIGWRDVLDIALVSVVLYRLLLLIRGTRAARMLMGLLLLSLATFLAGVVPLYTLDWLLQSVWAYVAIALIVVFQPEIRMALAKMGDTKIFGTMGSAEEFRGFEEILKGVAVLSARKTGALLVMQRETALKEFIEVGTQLDARISRELLICIFHTESPIHDGAVIIEGNRIRAAGCFLPLSLEQKATLRRDLGTRHRAALGITVETDAVVIIVSEESGGISLAVDGTLESFDDMSALRHRLTRIFTTAKSSSPANRSAAKSAPVSPASPSSPASGEKTE